MIRKEAGEEYNKRQQINEFKPQNEYAQNEAPSTGVRKRMNLDKLVSKDCVRWR